MFATPASACACGGVVSSDPGAFVADETALVSWDGKHTSILLRLGLQSAATDAALVFPTPAPAQVSAGSNATFDALERAAAPQVVTERRWFSTEDMESAGSGPGAPLVLDRVELGPIEATTLQGGDLPGLQKWLSDNDYELAPKVSAALAPYVAERWSFVAIRLTGSEKLDGALDPVRMDFDSDRFVYPMRMSAAAEKPQRARIYTLSDRRVELRDTKNLVVRTTFAGPASVDGYAGTYLTATSVFVGQPSTIDADFEFVSATSSSDYRETVYRTEDVRILGLMAGPVLVFAGAVLALGAVVFGLILLVRSRR